MPTQQQLDGYMNQAINAWAAGASVIRDTCLDALHLNFAAQWPANGTPPLGPPNQDESSYEYAVWLTISTAIAFCDSEVRTVIDDALFGGVGSFSRVWPTGGTQPPPPLSPP